MESYKTFTKNNLTVLAGHVLIYIQGIILMPIVIKTVGVTVYGGYILLSSLIGFMYGISSFGVGFKCGRFLPATEEKEGRRSLFYPQFSFQFLSIAILSLVLILFYPIFDKLFLKGELAFSKWIVFPYLFLLFLYSQVLSYFLSTQRVNYFNYVTVAYPYINIALIVSVYLLTHNLSINILFSSQAFSYLILTVPLVVMLIREIGFEFRLPDLKNLADDMRLGLPLRMNYLLDFILGSSDRYIITWFITVTAVGYYSPGYALGSLIVFFPKVSGVVLPPLLSKAIDTGNEAEAYTMVNYTIKGFLLLAIPFIAGGAVLSSPILNLLANADVSQKAYIVTPIIALATLFIGLNIILSNVLWVRMKTAVLFKMNVLTAFLNITLNIVFIYIFRNILAAAFTTLISYFIVFIFTRRAVTEDWPLLFDLKMIMKSIVSSLLMGSSLYGISSWLGNNAYKLAFLLGEILIGIIIYCLAIFAMKTFSNKELIYMKRVFS